MKDLLKSKLVWLGVLTSASGILSLVVEYLKNDTFNSPEGWFMFATGVIGVILRVYFTDTAIKRG